MIALTTRPPRTDISFHLEQGGRNIHLEAYVDNRWVTLLIITSDGQFVLREFSQQTGKRLERVGFMMQPASVDPGSAAFETIQTIPQGEQGPPEPLRDEDGGDE